MSNEISKESMTKEELFDLLEEQDNFLDMRRADLFLGVSITMVIWIYSVFLFKGYIIHLSVVVIGLICMLISSIRRINWARDIFREDRQRLSEEISLEGVLIFMFVSWIGVLVLIGLQYVGIV